MIDPTSAPGPRPDMKESAAALLSCITRMGGHSNRFHELSNVYSDLRLTLFAHDINIRLETSNLVSMPGIAFPTIALNELDLSGVEDAKRTRIEGYKGTSGMPTLMSASRSGYVNPSCSILLLGIVIAVVLCASLHPSPLSSHPIHISDPSSTYTTLLYHAETRKPRKRVPSAFPYVPKGPLPTLPPLEASLPSQNSTDPIHSAHSKSCYPFSPHS